MSNANEPAYPALDRDSCGDLAPRHFGLTKREAFAMAAMQGILANAKVGCRDGKADAAYAVQLADALLAELWNRRAPAPAPSEAEDAIPREPTAEMIEQGSRQYRHLYPSDIVKIWRAMWDAARGAK